MTAPEHAPVYIENYTMDRNLALETVRVVEAAALAASKWTGRGEEKAADQAAVNAMRRVLNTLNIEGTVVIGEGERDKAPMLYIGEKVGTGHGPQVDIALDPLEGTTICATGAPNSLAVLAMAEKGGFLHAPDVYMQKIAVGPDVPEGTVDLDFTPTQNLQNLAKAKGCRVQDLMAVILDRPRHAALIAEVRAAGARIQLIGDGDVAGIIAIAQANSDVHIYFGSGGAPEGVLAAAALRCTGGFMQGRLLFSDDEQRERAKRMGIEDLNKKYHRDELAKGDVMFAATGVTDGAMLKGVHRTASRATTQSIVMRSKTGTIRYVEAEHFFDLKAGGDPAELDGSADGQ